MRSLLLLTKEAMLMRRLKFTGFTESLTLFWPCPSKAFSDVFLGFWLWGPLEHLDPWPTRAGLVSGIYLFC